MILKILRNKEEGSLTSMCITPKDFTDKGYHPFLATQQFDKVIVELCEELPEGYIRQLLLKGNKVIPIVERPIASMKIISLLCEIYPDYSAKLRFGFMRSKEMLDELLNNLERDFNWQQEISQS